jgi:hypothetical protein
MRSRSVASGEPFFFRQIEYSPPLLDTVPAQLFTDSLLNSANWPGQAPSLNEELADLGPDIIVVAAKRLGSRYADDDES